MDRVRALLLTDVVDSTQLSECLGDRGMADLWARHDRVARDLLQLWRGHEIDKTDGIRLLFESASDAANYALAYHAALAELPVPLTARVGLHVGKIALRRNSDEDVARGAKSLEVNGIALPTAARVMSLASSGQTLMTSGARSELDDTHGPIRSHGHWLMKGLSEPIEVFELSVADRACPAPLDGDKAYRVIRANEGWRPAREIPNNLPDPVTSFIGRERELLALKRLLGEHRLLTVSGPGGCGKTRLCLQLAGESLPQFPEGVWLVELAPVTDRRGVAQAIADVLGLKEEPGKTIGETLTAHLRSRRTLLLLDNCEHLLDGCAQLAAGLLRHAPDLKIVASSREGLGIDGEQTYRVPSLSLPDSSHVITPISIAPFEAVRLFASRTLLCRPDFEITDQNAAAVASVCRRLDGIPLAIELAAARMRSISVDEIDRRIDRRFDLLTGGSRTALPRQQTLRALIDWSYELLSTFDRLALQRLSVFAGGWTLSNAEEVCAGDGIDCQSVMDLLASLCDKSLILVEEHDGYSRYSFLETVRQYARERLLKEGNAISVRERHLDCFLSLAEEADLDLVGPRQTIWLQRLESEHENLGAALAWSLISERGSGADLRLCGALLRFWLIRGHVAEGREWCERALARCRPQNRTPERGSALHAAGVLAEMQADYSIASAHHEEALAIRRSLEDQIGVALSLGNLGVLSSAQGDHKAAQVLLREALAIARDRQDQEAIVFCLLNLGRASNALGNGDGAQVMFTESLAIARRLADRRLVAQSLTNLAIVSVGKRDLASARTLQEQSLAITRELDDKIGIATNQQYLASLAFETEDYAVAEGHYRESLTRFAELGARRAIALSLRGLAGVIASLGHPISAARMWGAAQRLGEETGPVLRLDEGAVATARAALCDDVAFDLAWLDGRALALGRVVELATEGAICKL